MYKTKNTPKVVGGVTPQCTEIAAALYNNVLENKVHTVSSPAGKNEWEKVRPIYQGFLTDNIKIIHKSGKNLLPYYERADILNLFIKPIDYWNFAMPYKLFEYLGMQKPIIAVNNTASGLFVKENNIGWSIDYNEEKLKHLLIYLYKNKDLIKEKKEKMYIVAKNNLWTVRAKKVKMKLRNDL